MSDTKPPIETAAVRLEKGRRSIGLFLGPLLFVAVLLAPTTLEPRAHRLAAVFVLVIVFWVTEAIPLPATALLGAALTVPLGVAGARQAFASFSHPIIFLFLGSFLIARAMALHNLDRRIALFVLSRDWVGDRPRRILLAFGAIGAFLSMWMSNTATTAMMLPIALGVLRTLGADEEDNDGSPGGRYATGLLLMIAFSCSVGGLATPVGTPPNLIAIGMIEELLGRQITFFQWMLLGLPISVACFVFLYFAVCRMFARNVTGLGGASGSIREARSRLGKWSPGEKAALTAFLVAVTLWTVPGILALVLGADSPVASAVLRAIPNEPAAVLAALLLFVLPVDWPRRKFALGWREAVRIDWGTILLFGGGLSLGALAFDTGLAGALGDVLNRTGAILPASLVVLLAVLAGDLFTEFMSNTATANLLIPVFLAAGGGLTGNPILAALGATLGCSIAFCLPVATPPNAIVYGSGRVPLVRMIRAGIFLDLGCALIVWAILMAFSPWI
jgi:sodium-dependent dicarboxylate transporter 2/3/5